MELLNYNHLYYFWTVAREGSVSKAAKLLHRTQPTISGQIRALEEELGEQLFRRVGRGLHLTDAGLVTFRYCEEIFTIGRELQATLKDRPLGHSRRFLVGITDVMPKLIAYRLLKPALDLPEPVCVVCHEDQPDRLLGELAVHTLDLVLSDQPTNPNLHVKAYNHRLGECGVTFFATPKIKSQLKGRFPKCLHGAPFLLPTENCTLRGGLDKWFDEKNIFPDVVGEFEDSALMKVFGREGTGVFAVPTAVARDVEKQYGVKRVGQTEEIREVFYAISVERRITHPAVLAIASAAKHQIFRH
jgi:LysR family transcriptional activator of nhaA